MSTEAPHGAHRDPSTPATPFRALAVLLLTLAVVLLGTRLDATPITRSSERRCLVTAENMVASGDYLVPRLDGAPRLQKPPLYYWAVAATGSLAGGVTRAAGRAPSIVAGLALLGLVLAWGRSLHSARLGLGAGVLLLSMALFVTQARRGDAEMLLSACVIGALFVYDRIRYGGRRELLPVFAAALALGILSKATAAMLCIGLPVTLDLALCGELRRVLRSRVMIYVGLGITLGFGWHIALALMVPEAFTAFQNELLLPLKSTESAGGRHLQPVWYFAHQIVVAAAPAILLLPAAIAWARRSRWYRGHPRHRYVANAAVSLFVAFSLLPEKQKHYILPVLPLLALVLATSVLHLHNMKQRSWAREVACTVGIGGAVAAVALVLYSTGTLSLVWGAAAAVVVARGVWLARRRGCPLRHATTLYLGGAVLAIAAYHWTFLPVSAERHGDEAPVLRSEQATARVRATPPATVVRNAGKRTARRR